MITKTDASRKNDSQAGASCLAHFPIVIFAIIMGLSGLTLAFQTAGYVATGTVVLAITIMLFLTFAAVYAFKALHHPEMVKAEWEHPVKLAFFPTISISTLLIATALGPIRPEVARVIWLLGALAQAGFTLSVIANWIGHRAFQPIHMSPAWFIPAVGNVIAPLGGIGFGFNETSWVFFAGGLIFWLILLALVFNRLVFHDPMPERMVPTLAILIAPPAVAFLAWMQLNGSQIDAMAHILYAAALVFFALALTQVHKLLKLSFSLAWWALSFPLTALVAATLRYGDLQNSPAHYAAGQLALGAMCILIAGLALRTIIAALRGQICVPE
jgi:tellurite resistance protein